MLTNWKMTDPLEPIMVPLLLSILLLFSHHQQQTNIPIHFLPGVIPLFSNGYWTNWDIWDSTFATSVSLSNFAIFSPTSQNPEVIIGITVHHPFSKQIIFEGKGTIVFWPRIQIINTGHFESASLLFIQRDNTKWRIEQWEMRSQSEEQIHNIWSKKSSEQEFMTANIGRKNALL